MGKENSSSSVKPLKKYQIMCYGLGDLASQFVWTFVGSYLTIFYTDVVGFAPAIVSILMMVARIFRKPISGNLRNPDIHLPRSEMELAVSSGLTLLTSAPECSTRWSTFLTALCRVS